MFILKVTRLRNEIQKIVKYIILLKKDNIQLPASIPSGGLQTNSKKL